MASKFSSKSGRLGQAIGSAAQAFDPGITVGIVYLRACVPCNPIATVCGTPAFLSIETVAILFGLKVASS